MKECDCTRIEQASPIDWRLTSAAQSAISLVYTTVELRTKRLLLRLLQLSDAEQTQRLFP
jgi:hypothetical protein